MNLKDDKEDFFDGPDIPEIPKQPKMPELKPEDPDYWEQPESEFEHLKPKRKDWRMWAWVALVGVVIGVAITLYIRYFSPCVTEATQFGYVENIERRGSIFKTYEGVLIPYKELMDTTRVYERDFKFSVKNEKDAVVLRRLQYANLPARVEYERYHSTLPWRGDSKIVVIKVDTADASKILPPEFAPHL